MTGKEDLKPGDQLMCVSNEGTHVIGEIITIWGIDENSINISGSDTGWRNRNDFRWHCYKFHNMPEEIPEKIKNFNKHVDWVQENNKKLLENKKSLKMGKKLIEAKVHSDVSFNKPFRFKDFKDLLEDDDIVYHERDEGYVSSDSQMDPHFSLEIYRERYETDEEYQKRIEQRKKQEEVMRQRRYERYLELKKEFEDNETE